MRWLKTCQESHKQCLNSSSEAQLLPTRLIYVGSCRENVRLCESTLLPPGTPYATLSHCWGTESFLCLQRDNYDALHRKLPLKKLPRVFRDAITLTRKASLKYLWIDSLCIIQKCEEDWAQEATKMSSVYSNGVVNIAATGFYDGSRGLFVDRSPARMRPFPVEIERDQYFDEELAVPGGRYFLAEHGMWTEGVDDAPLNQRAWVVQERMLSPRTLHFGTRQVFWECRESEACEVFPKKLPKGMLFTNAKTLVTSGVLAKPHLQGLHQPSTMQRHSDASEADRSQQAWWQIIDTYTSKALTKKSDKLVAVAGLAVPMQNQLKSRYLAGMWETDLVNQLAWTAYRLQPKPDGFRCPSWSWASIDGPVKLDHLQTDRAHQVTLARVQEVNVTSAGKNDFGSITDGHLKLQGRLGLVRLYREGEPGQADRRVTTISSWISERVYLDVSDSAIGMDTQRIVSLQVLEANADTMDSMLGTQSMLVCFFMPIAIHNREERRGMMPKIVGLLLLPTEKARGEFRRIGMFTAHTKELVAQMEEPPGTIPERHYESLDEKDLYTICVR